MEKEQNHKDVELRSEKVRKIVGGIPSATIRYGIFVIALVIVIFIGMSMLIPCKETIQITASFDSKRSLTIGMGEINDYYRNILNVGMPIQLRINNNEIEGRIKEIVPQRINGICRFYIELSEQDEVDLPGPIQGYLSFSNQSYFEKVFSHIFHSNAPNESIK